MASKLTAVFIAIDNAIAQFTTIDWESDEELAWNDAVDSGDEEEIARTLADLDAYRARVEWLAVQAADCGRAARRALYSGDASEAESQLRDAYQHEAECGDATHWREALSAMESFDDLDEIEALQGAADGDLELVALCDQAINGDLDAKRQCMAMLAEVASLFAQAEAEELADAMDGRR